MTTHTPGPWEARADYRGDLLDGVTLCFWEVVRPDPRDTGPDDPNRDMICDMGAHPDGEANARLIAAAPELLESLTLLVDAVTNGKNWPSYAAILDMRLYEARAAIAKATAAAAANT